MQSIKKFTDGEEARRTWKKSLNPETCTIENFNLSCAGVFSRYANITLDSNPKRGTTIMTTPVSSDIWKQNGEYIYIIVKDGVVMKIGGTRTSMSERWGSYLCGHCVPQRNKKNGEPYPGKMSVTNAHLYHTIEHDLLENEGKWEFWCWKLPVSIVQVDIMGVPTEIVAQTFHAYESRCMEKFREITGHIPQLCDNADPSYR